MAASALSAEPVAQGKVLRKDMALPLVLGGKARGAASPVEDADEGTCVFRLDVLVERGEIAERKGAVCTVPAARGLVVIGCSMLGGLGAAVWRGSAACGW